MAKRDELDAQKAARLAWRVAPPGQRVDLDDLGGSEDDDEDAAALGEEAGAAFAPGDQDDEPDEDDEPAASPKLEARRREAAARCDALAVATARAWALGDGEAQAQATLELAREVVSLGLMITAMPDDSPAAVRLARLVVRHWDTLPRRMRRRTAYQLAFLDVTGEREAADLLVETAVRGDETLCYTMEQAAVQEDRMHRLHPDLGARLAAVLDDAPSIVSRRAAAFWLSCGRWPAAVPALQRALRGRLLGLRWVALEALLDYAPPAVTAADVRFLLDDAVVHPTPDFRGEQGFRDVMQYDDALARAVATLRPPGGEAPLAAIVRGECTHVDSLRAGLSDGWALGALAAGYPDAALPLVDRALRSPRRHERRVGVEAAAKLPPDAARPRLWRAATDPCPDLAEKARQAWFEREGAVCTADPADDVCGALLEAPPSESFRTRQMVLRGPSHEGRLAMVEALVGEAPGREALVLLLHALGDDALFMLAPRRPGLPSEKRAWATLLVERFGPPAFEGLLWLAERYPCASSSDGWLGALADLERRRLLPADVAARVRARAADFFLSPLWDGETDAPGLLARLPAPAGGSGPDVDATAVALRDRLWEVAFEDVPSRWRWARHDARLALGAWPADATLDARLSDGAAAARAAGQHERFADLARVGLERRLPAVAALAQEVLAAEPADDAAVDAAASVGWRWAQDHPLGEAWYLEALGRPASRRFSLGVRLLAGLRRPSRAARAALRAALGSTARGGAAEAEAAHELLRRGLLRPDDPRLPAILAGAPAGERAALVGELRFRKVPFARIREALSSVLTGPDEKAAMSLYEALYLWDDPGAREVMGEAYARVPHVAVREAIEHVLELPTEAERYWGDVDQPEDEEPDPPGGTAAGDEDDEDDDGGDDEDPAGTAAGASADEDDLDDEG
jgi:hypothetical protein